MINGRNIKLNYNQGSRTYYKLQNYIQYNIIIILFVKTKNIRKYNNFK